MYEKAFVILGSTLLGLFVGQSIVFAVTIPEYCTYQGEKIDCTCTSNIRAITLENGDGHIQQCGWSSHVIVPLGLFLSLALYAAIEAIWIKGRGECFPALVTIGAFTSIIVLVVASIELSGYNSTLAAICGQLNSTGGSCRRTVQELGVAMHFIQLVIYITMLFFLFLRKKNRDFLI